jgi:predicted transport protein
MSSTTSVAPSLPWLAIPVELKLMILNHCIITNQQISQYIHLKNLENLLNIALVNQELRKLAVEMYYSNNDFKIGPNPTRITRYSRSIFKYPNPSVAH